MWKKEGVGKGGGEVGERGGWEGAKSIESLSRSRSSIPFAQTFVALCAKAKGGERREIKRPKKEKFRHIYMRQQRVEEIGAHSPPPVQFLFATESEISCPIKHPSLLPPPLSFPPCLREIELFSFPRGGFLGFPVSNSPPPPPSTFGLRKPVLPPSRGGPLQTRRRPFPPPSFSGCQVILSHRRRDFRHRAQQSTKKLNRTFAFSANLSWDSMEKEGCAL